MSNIIDINGNEVNPPTMPTPRPPTEAEIEQSSLQLQAFDDGFIFKFTHHPTEDGRFVLFDRLNNPIGVIRSAPIAQLICDALRAMFAAVAMMKREERAGTPDNLVADANRAITIGGGHSANERDNPPVMES